MDENTQSNVSKIFQENISIKTSLKKQTIFVGSYFKMNTYTIE